MGRYALSCFFTYFPLKNPLRSLYEIHCCTVILILERVVAVSGFAKILDYLAKLLSTDLDNLAEMGDEIRQTSQIK